MNRSIGLTAVLLIALYLGCNASEPVSTSSEPKAAANVPKPTMNWQDEIAAAEFRILAFGNSHVQNGEPLNKLRALLEHSFPDKKVAIQMRGGMFLADMAQNPSTEQLIRALPWTHLILQAQKYSTSGKYHYPTTAAEQFAATAKENGTAAIMFPEWPERDQPEQGPRIQQLHESIADKTGAIVSPIGLAWIEYGNQFPKPTMYSADGNHSNSLGAWMTAAVLYCTIAQHSPEAAMKAVCPPKDGVDFEAMGRIAWETYREQGKK